MNAWANIPEVEGIVDCYEAIYETLQHPKQGPALKERARQGALAYDWDIVMRRYWKPFLDRLVIDLGVAERPAEHIPQAMEV